MDIEYLQRNSWSREWTGRRVGTLQGQCLLSVRLMRFFRAASNGKGKLLRVLNIQSVNIA